MQVSTSHFRCHCNEPTCVRTSYLCKSQMGCYVLKTPSTSSDWSNFKSTSTNEKRRPNRRQSSTMATATAIIFKYGCIEYLADDLTYKCWSDDVLDLLKNPNKIRIMPENRSDFIKSSDRRRNKVKKSSSTDQKLTCCFDDLCNNEFEQNMEIEEQRILNRMNVKNEDFMDATSTPNQDSNLPPIDPLTGFYNPTVILILLFICFVCLFLMARFVYYDFYSTSRRGKDQSSSLIIREANPLSTNNQILISRNHETAADQYYYDEQNINWQSSKLDEKLKTFTLLMSKNDWLDAAAKNSGGKR
uniref:Uncharacterized protein n=1 Tax=Romanomermis culicivorax TaxID=13658 RepID=A0A915KTN8_ROMCU